jgi:hypothetical protein
MTLVGHQQVRKLVMDLPASELTPIC